MIFVDVVLVVVEVAAWSSSKGRRGGGRGGEEKEERRGRQKGQDGKEGGRERETDRERDREREREREREICKAVLGRQHFRLVVLCEKWAQFFVTSYWW